MFATVAMFIFSEVFCVKNQRNYKPEATSDTYRQYNQSRDGAHVQSGRLSKSNEMLDYGYNPQAENDYFR